MNNLVILMLFSLMITSCGKDSGSGSSESQQEQQEELRGKYKAVLRPISSTISGWIPYGNAEITVDESNIHISTYLDDDQRVMHLQSIHEGKRCPNIEDDRNKDGVIDAIEAEAVVGKVLVPLDGDITSQKKGEKSYPSGSSFTYKRTAAINDLISDLYMADDNPNDSVKKLTANDPFNLSGKVVLIHGTAATNKVPQTLQTHNGLASNLSVPIVCGIIKRIE